MFFKENVETKAAIEDKEEFADTGEVILDVSEEKDANICIKVLKANQKRIL